MSDKRMIDPDAPYGGTDFTAMELMLIGDALLTWVTTVSQLGHDSPGSSLDYAKPTGLICDDLVRDFVAWTSGRESLAPGCEERLRTEVAESGWTQFAVDRAGKRLFDEDAA